MKKKRTNKPLADASAGIIAGARPDVSTDPGADAGAGTPFWRTKTLEAMTPQEWESLCDGCGRCCLNKLQDEDTDEIYLTRLSCALLDIGTCRCSDYENRKALMPDCVRIDAEKARTLPWLPATCAYRLVAEERDLPWWHPLVSGDQNTVHQAGISVRHIARSEKGIKLEAYAKYIIPDFKAD